jgi:hypothetical protein
MTSRRREAAARPVPMIKRGFRYETPYESPLDHGEEWEARC